MSEKWPVYLAFASLINTSSELNTERLPFARVSMVTGNVTAVCDGVLADHDIDAPFAEKPL